jgi:hypothetical protein
MAGFSGDGDEHSESIAAVIYKITKRVTVSENSELP